MEKKGGEEGNCKGYLGYSTGSMDIEKWKGINGLDYILPSLFVYYSSLLQTRVCGVWNATSNPALQYTRGTQQSSISSSHSVHVRIQSQPVTFPYPHTRPNEDLDPNVKKKDPDKDASTDL